MNRHTQQVQLEALEDRTLMSTCNVTRLGDAGNGNGFRGDLRYCITEANDGPGPDSIVFSVRGTINLTNALPDLVSDIAQASTEQATGLEQINKALMQMDEVTQQNAALVEENAATAKALETQAQSMDEQVAFFKIDAVAAAGGGRARPAARPVAAAPQVTRAAEPKVVTPRAPVHRAAPVRTASPRNPVGRMQTALATALDADNEWKDF